MRESISARLFGAYRGRIEGYLRRTVRDDALAEDLTQEVFLRAVRHPAPDGSAEHAVAWLFTIARNLARDHGRSAARRPADVLHQAERTIPIDPLQHLSYGLAEALDQLEETERDVFLLREVGGLGYREIASVCALTPDAVRSRIHRARLALRERLAPALSRARAGLRQEVHRDSGTS